jgi:hypothetical protein
MIAAAHPSSEFRRIRKAGASGSVRVWRRVTASGVVPAYPAMFSLSDLVTDTTEWRQQLAQEEQSTVREATRKSVGRIGTIKPYTVKGPVTLQVEYTTRNSLALDAELRVGAEVLDDRTIRFKGQDILEVWRLYRSR